MSTRTLAPPINPFAAPPAAPTNLIGRRDLAHQAIPVPQPSAPFASRSPLVAGSASMEELLQRAAKVAQFDLTTLLTGESGTGKTTLARLIHELSPRRDKPFVVVNCASLPRELLEAELFGHARGAFTGAVQDRPGRVESCDGGTLLLDEIGDLPLELQPKLLTFLQDHTFYRIGSDLPHQADVRVLAATNQQIADLCREQRFREDLYFRLSVLRLDVPPLRERASTIPTLVDDILSRIAARGLGSPKRPTAATLQRLQRHRWPGNVRELENVLQRACVFAESELIQVDDLVFDDFGDQTTAVPDGALAGRTLQDIERQAIRETLHACGGNKALAARTLGISERSIYNKLKRFDLEG